MSPFARHTLNAKRATAKASLLAPALALLFAGLTGFSTFSTAQSAVTASESAPQTAAQTAAQLAARSAARPARDSAKMQAWHAKRMAAFKERLKITPEQEANWAAFAAGMASSAIPSPAMVADQGAAGMQRPNWAELEKLSTPERLDKLRAFREAREGQFKAVRVKREEAVQTFYPTLSAEQKKVFDAAMLRLLQRRLGGHGAHGEQDGGGMRGDRAGRG